MIPLTPENLSRRSFLTTGAAATAAAMVGTGLLPTGVAHAVGEGDPIVPLIRSEFPRLYTHDFAPVAERIDSEETIAAWYEALVARAEEYVEAGAIEYDIPDGVRLLETSREMLRRSFTLGLVRRVSGDLRFHDALVRDLDAVCAFPDWNPSHFLDVAEMTHAVAVGYDWLHQDLDVEQRARYESAMISFGLEPGMDIYVNGHPDNDWPRRTSNWNIVCNAGMITGAISISHVQPELAEEIFAEAFASLPVAIAEYAPDGAYPEGVMYWKYATQYLVAAMATLESATGSTHDIEDSEGLASTGDFTIHMTGPLNENFNFYDASTGAPQTPELMWLARAFDEPTWGWWGRLGADLEPHALNVLWYDPELDTSAFEAEMERDSTFDKVELVSMRSAWNDRRAAYLAAKGGYPAIHSSHADLDLGSFVLDALGVRWATEFLTEDYNVEGYWENRPGGQRWTYYRRRAEGQNTMVFGPGMSDDQNAEATGELIRHESGPEDSFAIFDLTEADERLKSWQRGFRLFDGRRRALIQDRFRTATRLDAFWFLHTPAEIEISEGGKSALLTRNNQRLRADLLSPEDASFLVLDAEPLWTSPQPEQSVNEFTHKLTVRLRDVRKGSVVVALTPLYEGAEEPPAPEAPRSLPAWRLLRPPALLRELELDGERLAQFRPEVFHYTVLLPVGAAVPHIDAVAEARGNVEVVSAPEQVPGLFRLRTTSPGHETVDTTISVVTELGEPGSWSGIVAASEDDGNIPRNVLDGNLVTRWSALGDGQWLAVDLGENGQVDAVELAFFNGDRRASYFAVETARDGGTWERLLNAESSGETNELEPFELPAHTARYLRVIMYGNSDNAWGSITELRVPGRELTMPPSPPQYRGVEIVEAPEALAVGEGVRLTLRVLRADGSESSLDAAETEWLSSDPDVISLGDDGTATAHGPGAARLSAVVTLPDRHLLHTSAEVSVR